jgi:hypothetical protein
MLGTGDGAMSDAEPPTAPPNPAQPAPLEPPQPCRDPA